MITDARWKYVYSQAAGGTEELYDQENDRSELCNLAADPRRRGLKNELRARLNAIARELDDTAIFDGAELKTSDAYTCDPTAKRMIGGMGWRWY